MKKISIESSKVVIHKNEFSIAGTAQFMTGEPVDGVFTSGTIVGTASGTPIEEDPTQTLIFAGDYDATTALVIPQGVIMHDTELGGYAGQNGGVDTATVGVCLKGILYLNELEEVNGGPLDSACLDALKLTGFRFYKADKYRVAE